MPQLGSDFVKYDISIIVEYYAEVQTELDALVETLIKKSL